MIPFEIENLKDGKVSYRKLGKGPRKIIFFHGFPGSSLQIQIFEPLVESLGLEVLCFDRPGYNRTMLANSKDNLELVAMMTEHFLLKFNWSSCELISVSGGTPYALWVASRHSRRVQSVHVISGMVPLEDASARSHFPLLSRTALRALPWIPGKSITSLLGKREEGLDRARSKYLHYFLKPSRSDQTILANTNVEHSLTESLREALHQHGIGPKKDAKVFLSPWSQNLKNLPKALHFWHGSEDQIIKVTAAKAFSKKFPSATFTELANEGHFSLAIGRIAEVLNEPPPPSNF